MGVRRIVQLLRDNRFDEQYSGLVKVESRGPFQILNYTLRCQYARAWDEVTRFSRGLIVDTRDWSIAAFVFPKFFNLDECEETKLENLPNVPFHVTEKMDGSLGVLWRDEGGVLRIATRGSFTSEQAEWGTAFLHTLPNFEEIPANYTMLFEIVYADNKSVIRYPFEGLVLLTIMDRWNLRELSLENVQKYAKMLGIPTPKTYQFPRMEAIREAASVLPYDEEGYVIRFENGLRVKVKGKEYLRLHKLYLGHSEARITRAITDGSYEQLLEHLPEELRKEAEDIGDAIFSRSDGLREESVRLFREAPKGSRKDFAIWVTGNVRPELMSTLFLLLDGRDVDWVQLAIKVGEKS